MTKYYADIDGNLIGGFDGNTGKVPDGAIEVPFPPSDGRFKWNGSTWIEPVELKDKIVDEKRSSETLKRGITLEDRVNALWLKQKGDSSNFDAIEIILNEVEADIPNNVI